VADFENTDAKPYDWAIEFDERVKRDYWIVTIRHCSIIRMWDRITALSVPTLDHYLPMIFAIALQQKDDELNFTYEGFQNASVSMRCFQSGKGRLPNNPQAKIRNPSMFPRGFKNTRGSFVTLFSTAGSNCGISTITVSLF